MACDQWWICMFAALAVFAVLAAVPLVLFWLWVGLPV